MPISLSQDGKDKLKRHRKTMAAVTWANSLSSVCVVGFLLYAGGRLSAEPGSELLIYFVSAVIFGFAVLSHRKLAGRLRRVRTDLEGGVAEEILGPMEKIKAAGGYALKIGEQKFVVDEGIGRDLPEEGNMRLLYAPQSRVVLSVESL